MRWPFNKKQKTIPSGFTAKDIHTESSICTGETTIGFYCAATGRLAEAVAVQTPPDIDAFYRSYGLEPPAKTKKTQ